MVIRPSFSPSLNHHPYPKFGNPYTFQLLANDSVIKSVDFFEIRFPFFNAWSNYKRSPTVEYKPPAPWFSEASWKGELIRMSSCHWYDRALFVMTLAIRNTRFIHFRFVCDHGCFSSKIFLKQFRWSIPARRSRHWNNEICSAQP